MEIIIMDFILKYLQQKFQNIDLNYYFDKHYFINNFIYINILLFNIKIIILHLNY